MERMLVIVFNDEAKAYEGSHALKQLDAEGSIAIHAAAVIKKNADGTVTVTEEEEDFPIRAVAGTAIGALIGLLEGPVGLALGAATGTLAGSIGDLHLAGVDAEFVDELPAGHGRGGTGDDGAGDDGAGQCGAVREEFPEGERGGSGFRSQ